MPEFGLITCAGCGLLCDDVTVEASGDAARFSPECGLGAQWFSERMRRLAADAAPASIRGQAADVGSALRRATELLRNARRPLVHGFDGATVEDVRAAAALADRLGALLAPDGVVRDWSGAPAASLRGASTATLGEIRDRSRVAVIWREDPERTHPRLLERLGRGEEVGSELGGERTLVVIDDRTTATTARADVLLRSSPERDLEALITLHALQRGLSVRTSDLVEPLSAVLERIRSAPHVAFVYGANLTGGGGGQRRALALNELVRALCRERHAVTLALPRTTGATGARDAVAWQTGYSGTVDLARGHPELLTSTKPLDDVDVALSVEGAPGATPGGAVGIALCSLPVPEVEVSIRTAAAGVERGGTAHRLDGVPLALQAPLSGETPSAAALLTRLLGELER